MIVIDASAAVEWLLNTAVGEAIGRRVFGETSFLCAPHLLDVELVNAFRRLVRSREITEQKARDALLEFANLSIVRYPHIPLIERIWTLRDTVSAYDATYIALAEALSAPLITCDARLSSALGSRARIEVIS